MAEPGLLFFSILAFSGTMWLVHRLSAPSPPSLPWLLCTAGLTGLGMGLAAGVKLNGVLLFIGFIVVLFTLGYRSPRHYLLLTWLAAVAFLIAVAGFILTNPFLWHSEILERFHMTGTFRVVDSTSQQIRYGQDHLNNMVDSLQAALFQNSFNYGRHNLLPGLVSIPLCMVGLWYGLARRHILSRASHIWFLSIGLTNALIVPLNWERYFIFTILAVHLFTGLGAWVIIQTAWQHLSPLRIQTVKKETRTAPTTLAFFPYNRLNTIAAVVCILGATALVLQLGISSLQFSRERSLWKDYIVAETWPVRIQTLNQIVEHNPQAGSFYTGKPLLILLPDIFQEHQHSMDPVTLQAVTTSGQLLQTYSPDPDLQARLAYDLPRLDQRLDHLIHNPISLGPFQPASPPQKETNLWPLGHNREVLRRDLTLSTAGYYRFNLTAQHGRPAPIEIGLSLDGRFLGRLIYDRGDDSFSRESLTAYLDPGPHTVQLELLNDLYNPDQNLDRNALIQELTVQPVPAKEALTRVCAAEPYPTPIPAKRCLTGQPPLLLQPEQPVATLVFTAPVPALYDLQLGWQNSLPTPHHLQATLDKRPLGGQVEIQPQPAATVRQLPPVYLTPGQHHLTLTLTPISTTQPLTFTAPLSSNAGLLWQELRLKPRYPAIEEMSPAEFSPPSNRQPVILTGTSSISSTWKWYGAGYDFYHIHLFGYTGSTATATLTVSIDGQAVGPAKLDQYGTPPPPLAVELARGSSHTLAIQTTDLTGGDGAYLDAVEIRPYQGPLIFAGSNMRWPKEHNRSVTTAYSIIHLPRQITLTKAISIKTAGRYSVTVRYRLPSLRSPAAAQPKLHLAIDGKPIAQTSLLASPDWAEHTFTASLPQGQHLLQLWWTGDPTMETVDLMHVIVENQDDPWILAALVGR